MCWPLCRVNLKISQLSADRAPVDVNDARSSPRVGLRGGTNNDWNHSNLKQLGHIWYSESDLGSSPVSSLGVVPDLVVSSVSDPVRQSSVLLDLLCDSGFLVKTLDRAHFRYLRKY